MIYDSGAAQYIDTIVIDAAKARAEGAPPGRRAKITIVCNRSFAYPPLLSIVESGEARIDVQCGEKFDWIFAVDFGGDPAAGGPNPGGGRRYCVEVRLDRPRGRVGGKTGDL